MSKSHNSPFGKVYRRHKKHFMFKYGCFKVAFGKKCPFVISDKTYFYTINEFKSFF